MVLSPERMVYTSKEFDRWWEGQDLARVLQLDPVAAKLLAWEAWRTGREQLHEATASQRLQVSRK